MRVEANPYAYLAHHGTSPLVRLEVGTGWTAISADTDARPLNTVFAHSFTVRGLPGRVRAICGRAPHSRAQDWWVGPDAQPSGLAARLEALGLEPLPPVRMMTARLAAVTPAERRVDVRPVTTRAELADFMGVYASAYGWTAVTSDFGHRVLASLFSASSPDDAPLGHVVVRADGTPVAVASVFRHEGVAGLYNVATDPRARGRGFATAAVRAALSRAYDDGLRTAVLGAEPGAEGIYRRIGFTNTGLLHRLRYTAPAADGRIRPQDARRTHPA